MLRCDPDVLRTVAFLSLSWRQCAVAYWPIESTTVLPKTNMFFGESLDRTIGKRLP